MDNRSAIYFLEHVRTQLGISQKHFARIMGFGYQSYLTYTRSPDQHLKRLTVDQFLALQKLSGLSPKEFLSALKEFDSGSIKLPKLVLQDIGDTEEILVVKQSSIPLAR